MPTPRVPSPFCNPAPVSPTRDLLIPFVASLLPFSASWLSNRPASFSQFRQPSLIPACAPRRFARFEKGQVRPEIANRLISVGGIVGTRFRGYLGQLQQFVFIRQSCQFQRQSRKRVSVLSRGDF